MHDMVRLYERVITEHINSWYSELSHDEEFIQEIRHLFRDTTTEVLTRLTRVIFIILCNFCLNIITQVDITETILNDIIPVAIQHLDSYLWAVKHCSMCEVGYAPQPPIFLLADHPRLTCY